MLTILDILSKVLLGMGVAMFISNKSKKKSENSKQYESWKVGLSLSLGVVLTFIVAIIENSIEAGLL